MEEQKELEQKQAVETQEATPAPEESQARYADDDEDYIATAEDLEIFMKERREREKQKQEQREEKVDVFGEYQAPPESTIDPYMDPDPEIPWVKYEEDLFLSRGCKHCPQSYKPVKESEVRSCSKVTSMNWLRGIRQPGGVPFDCVEVRFKNHRKDFFRLPDGLEVTEGDVVAVEGQPGHDIGIVSLTGEVCRIQMKKRRVDPKSENIRRLFRRAKSNDIERWAESLKVEQGTLLRTRQIAQDLGLEMKVNDVEYQGDYTKAIFYYTADDRVDFRSLIKILAEEFHVRVEMKQIGVRQEAGKVGGLGTCGRELCCSTWLTNFKSVTTSAAKTQQILPNPQKLAGQCGKLKCCLNFECEVYADALKKFPPANTPIRFKEGLALYKKTDVFRGIMWYAYEGKNELYALKAESVKEIIEMNRNQQYPERIEDFQVELMSNAALEQETSTAEFERELKMMADDQSEPAASTAERPAAAANNNRRDRNNNRREDNRPRPRNERNERNERTERNERNERARQDDRRRQNEMRQRADNRRVQGEQRTRNNPQRRSSDRDKRGGNE
ncbi:MAG: hypothetical protein J6W95_00420 [Bacteroidales bacterium]|nr:hypothetical protein [Bacteroidales bacterium]